MMHSSLAAVDRVRDHALENELHVCPSALGPELACLARKLTDRSTHLRWRALNNPSSERLVELFTLYRAGEMTPQAAAVFERVVARNPVLGDHLAPLREVWDGSPASHLEPVTDAQVDVAFNQLQARMMSNRLLKKS
jgi:hypothetical protein